MQYLTKSESRACTFMLVLMLLMAFVNVAVGNYRDALYNITIGVWVYAYFKRLSYCNFIEGVLEEVHVVAKRIEKDMEESLRRMQEREANGK